MYFVPSNPLDFYIRIDTNHKHREREVDNKRQRGKKKKKNANIDTKIWITTKSFLIFFIR